MKVFTALKGGSDFEATYSDIKRYIYNQDLQYTGQWQSQNEPQASVTREAPITLEYQIPDSTEDLQNEVMPNLPWAETHFMERVSGIPYNPPPSAGEWPFRRNGHKEHLHDGKFSHTYPERFWPPLDRLGIRFRNGDLADLLKLLIRQPLTRQAYLPVWFPEDTGSVEGQRVPCTLGYHFLYRHGGLNCFYFMRSCDLIRHFPDDVYMAGRLTQWLAERMQLEVAPGLLTMVVSSMHTFKADDYVLKKV